MTLLTYQVFQTVAGIGSFHKAAEVLGLTPSAISHTISSMEKELGFPVLTRNKRGVVLTSYGEHILPYINAVLNSEEVLKQEIAEYKGLKTGTVRIGCFSSVCTNWMPAIIKSFEQEYPGIHLEVYEGTYDDVRYWIRNGVVDFGFLSTSSAGDLPIEPFYEDPLLCIVPKGYKKKTRGKSIGIEEMAKQRFVSQRESTDADIQNYMKENHLNVTANYHVVDDLSTVIMVESGFGICIMPELVMHHIPYEVESYAMKPAASRIIGLSCLDPGFMAPAVRSLYSHILEKYRNISK